MGYPSPPSICRASSSSPAEPLWNSTSSFPPPNPWQPTFYFVSMILTVPTPSDDWNHLIHVLLWVASCTRNNVFKVHPWCSMRGTVLPLLRLNNIPLFACTTFCLSVCLLMDTWVASTFRLLQIMVLWAWVHKYFFETLLSILLGVYPEGELLDHVVILFLIFGATAILFPRAAAAFCIPPGGAQGFQVLHILTSTCFLWFWQWPS